MNKLQGDVFADTVFWVALIDRKDQLHQAAALWSQNIAGDVITSEAVLTETANHLSRPEWRTHAVDLIDGLARQPKTKIVAGDPDLWSRGFSLYRNRADKGWSLTDCISFVIMADLKLMNVLTADVHFQQAGFRALLLETP